jgi:uncharacterized protein
MRRVVADTSPLFYLLSIGHIDLLRQVFATVLFPRPCRGNSVILPRRHSSARVEMNDDVSLRALGAGEQAAIAVALSLRADLILIDERKGAHVAITRGFEVTGTLGILALAARRELIDLADAFPGSNGLSDPLPDKTRRLPKRS